MHQNDVGGNDILDGGSDDTQYGDAEQHGWHRLWYVQPDGGMVMISSTARMLRLAMHQNSVGGNDILNGGSGDTLYGDADNMDGTADGGNDVRNGGPDNHLLWFGDADNSMDGTAHGGNDVLNGGRFFGDA